MKCETPAFASGSSRAPAPIQKPSDTERTLVSRSVISRSPESSSERTYSCTQAETVALSASASGTRAPRKKMNAATAPTAANATRAANAQW